MAEARDEIWDEWRDRINMTPSKLEGWLKTDESRSAGDDSDDGESDGHLSARRFVEIKRTKKTICRTISGLIWLRSLAMSRGFARRCPTAT